MKTLTFKSIEAKEILLNEGVLALPTETVYGLGIRWDSEKAYDDLFAIKKRKPDKPVAVMISNHFDLDKHFDISSNAKKVMNKFLPGPLTCLVKVKNVPYQAHLGTNIAGIRMPGSKELLDFLDFVEVPLQVTSANLSGEPAIKDFNLVYKTFSNDSRVQGIIKGECNSGTPTTVVDLTKDRPVVIRVGEISLEDIEEAFYK